MPNVGTFEQWSPNTGRHLVPGHREKINNLFSVLLTKIFYLAKAFWIQNHGRISRDHRKSNENAASICHCQRIIVITPRCHCLVETNRHRDPTYSALLMGGVFYALCVCYYARYVFSFLFPRNKHEDITYVYNGSIYFIHDCCLCCAHYVNMTYFKDVFCNLLSPIAWHTA